MARPPVGDTRDPDPCICGHDEDEHTLAGCDSYTPTWPRLVRCPCTEFQPDRIASDNPVPVDESAVTDFLNTVGDTTDLEQLLPWTVIEDVNGDIWQKRERRYGSSWYQPGDGQPHGTWDIAQPVTVIRQGREWSDDA